MDEFNFDILTDVTILDAVTDDIDSIEFYAVSSDGDNIADLSAYFEGNIVEYDVWVDANDGYSGVGGYISAEA